MALDRAISDRLRARLGITAEDLPHRLERVATAEEVRAFKAAVRLSVTQLAKELGISKSVVSDWTRRGVSARALRNAPVAVQKFQGWIREAREMHALVIEPQRERRVGAPKADRPPAELEYRCVRCGAGSPDCPDKPLPWDKVRRAPQGGENWIHGRPACGPVQPGGLRHRVMVLTQHQERQEESNA